MMRTVSNGWIAVCIVSLLICCGGGGGGANSSTAAAAAARTVSGVAANGAAMTGTVYLKDAKGFEKQTVIGSGGSFLMVVDDLTAPFLLKAVAPDNATTRYSFAAAEGTVNINPFTHVAVTGAAGTADLDTFYRSAYVNQHAALLSAFNDYVAALKNQLGPLFTAFSVTDKDFVSGNIQIGKGVDAIFDNIKMTVNVVGNTVTLYRSDPNKPFVTLTLSGVVSDDLSRPGIL